VLQLAALKLEPNTLLPADKMAQVLALAGVENKKAEEQVMTRAFGIYERLFPDIEQRIAQLAAYLKKQRAMLRRMKAMTKEELEERAAMRAMLVATQREYAEFTARVLSKLDEMKEGLDEMKEGLVELMVCLALSFYFLLSLFIFSVLIVLCCAG
jgi:hypothetical protein